MLIEEPEGYFPENGLAGHPRIHLGSDITIGMSAHGNQGTTREALTSLFLSVEGDYELILVDDCSADQTLDLFCSAADHHRNTRIFSFGKNLEYSGSLNAILSHATGTFVIFISNDIFVTPAYVATLLEVARHSDVYGIVRGCSNFVDNGKDLYNVFKDKTFTTYGDMFSAAAEMREKCRFELADDEFLTGDAFLVSRKLLDTIGTLDPLFYGYFCDHDMGVRARKAGFSPVLARGAFALHMHTANFDYLPDVERQAKSTRRWSRVYENWARFKLKYGMPVELPYSGIRNIPWKDISAPSDTQQIFQHPGDYSDLCIHSPDMSDTVAIQQAQRARDFFYAARLEEGEKLCRWGLRQSPEHPAVLSSLATILTYQCRVDEAINAFRTALSVNSRDAKAFSSLLLAMNYSERFSQKQIYEESLTWSETFCVTPEHAPEPRPVHRPIRVGFVSGDFRCHSISYFLEPLLENICRERFQIYCYSDVISPDMVTATMINLADVWHDVSKMEDEELAALVRKDQVDILIDLAGHSGRRIRLPVFCSRPAPVQVSWLGYPNTTGVSAVHYRLTDGIADPVGPADDQHSETLVRMPNSFICYKPPADAPEPSAPPSLLKGYVTFGSFNMLPKLSPTTILLWAKIMRRVTDSRLLLKCHYFSDAATAQRVRGFFRDYGIDGSRIELRPSTPGLIEHLETYNEIDIALDTFPYNGTTTTLEALWMGVPVVTMSGDRHASRVGRCILEHAGLDHLVSSSATGYIECAASLADRKDKLGSLRPNLRNILHDSVLCNARMFTDSFQDQLERLFISENIGAR